MHFCVRGCHPVSRAFPDAGGQLLHGRPATPGRQRLPLTRARVWAGALSLAATRAISVDFSSSGYLDVSVPPVRLINLWIQLMIVCRNTLGFPIRKSPVITVHITSPTLIAD